jgi:hypothetical protein
LNPALLPTSSKRPLNGLNQQASNLPPYHPNYRPPGEEAEEDWERGRDWEGSEPELARDEEEEEEDDDTPLGETLRRRRNLDPSQWEEDELIDEMEADDHVRVREGSEGYEVRPVQSVKGSYSWNSVTEVNRRLIEDYRRGVMEFGNDIVVGDEVQTYDDGQAYDEEGWEELERMADGTADKEEKEGPVGVEEFSRWGRYKRYVAEPDGEEDDEYSDDAGSEHQREGM